MSLVSTATSGLSTLALRVVTRGSMVGKQPTMFLPRGPNASRNTGVVVRFLHQGRRDVCQDSDESSSSTSLPTVDKDDSLTSRSLSPSRPRIVRTMSPGPRPVRRYGTASTRVASLFDDSMMAEYNGYTTTTMCSAVRHLGRYNFDEDYDEWSLYAAPTNNTNSDLGQLPTGAAVSAVEVLTTTSITTTLTRPEIQEAVLTSTILVDTLPDEKEEDELYVDEMEEDWRILHESRGNVVLGDYDGEDLSLEY